MKSGSADHGLCSDMSASVESECSSEAMLFNINSADLHLLEYPPKKRVLFDVSNSSSDESCSVDQIDITEAEETLRNIFNYAAQTETGHSKNPVEMNIKDAKNKEPVTLDNIQKEATKNNDLSLGTFKTKSEEPKVTFDCLPWDKKKTPTFTTDIPLGDKILNQFTDADETSMSSYQMKNYNPNANSGKADGHITSEESSYTTESDEENSESESELKNMLVAAVQMLPNNISFKGEGLIEDQVTEMPTEPLVDQVSTKVEIPEGIHNHFKTLTIEDELECERPVSVVKSENSKTFEGLKRKLSFKWPNNQAVIKGLESRIEYLQKVVDSQKESLNQYEELTLHLQKEAAKHKENYDNSAQENLTIFNRYKECQKELNDVSVRLQTLLQIVELEDFSTEKKLDHLNITMQNNTSMENFQQSFQDLQRKNLFLQRMFLFLTKKVNNIYKYTIAPALYLAELEPESASDNLSFESTNTIQAFLSSNFEVFKAAYDMSLIEKTDKEEEYKAQQDAVLERMDDYFERLNGLIASKLETVVREKLSV